MSANLLRKVAGRAPLGLIKFLGNIWLPYLGAGVRVLEVSSDFRYIKVCLKRTWYNANYVGTQFGGSIYAMTDPFYMLMLLNILGDRYVVWDKAACVDFVKPGRTALFAEFRLDEEFIELVKTKTASNEKYIFDLPVEVRDDSGQVVATVKKTIYVRLKKEASRS